MSEMDGFRLVYQGGHHDVFCNGTAHIWKRGGWALIETERTIIRSGRCDCALYRKPEAHDENPH